MIEALAGLAGMFLLTLLRLPIAFAMTIAGFVGLAVLRGTDVAIASSTAVVYETGFSYSLSVVPLFVLMGNFVTQAGMSEELYRAAYAFIGHRRGGLAMSTVLSCAGFAALSGSSLATAATMSKVAMPSMRKYGYSDALATGSIAAGGTLGILIPPSVIMIIYGIMTKTNIGELFAAGILPGLLGVVCYLGAIFYTTSVDRKSGPPGERLGWKERLEAIRGIGTFCLAAVILVSAVAVGLLSDDHAGVVGAASVAIFSLVFRGVMSVIALFALVMGGIYGGIFTPTEAAGVGAACSFLFALVRRTLTFRIAVHTIVDAAITTAMLFMVLIGALIFANFMNYTNMPQELRAFVAGLNVGAIWIYIVILIVYIFLGCVLEGLSMILLTIPIFFPLVVHLGADPVWFGILVVMIVEISLITPPIGMNVFVIRTILPEIPIGTLYKGVLPFVVADIVRIALIIAFPAIVLFLPNLLFK